MGIFDNIFKKSDARRNAERLKNSIRKFEQNNKTEPAQIKINDDNTLTITYPKTVLYPTAKQYSKNDASTPDRGDSIDRNQDLESQTHNALQASLDDELNAIPQSDMQTRQVSSIEAIRPPKLVRGNSASYEGTQYAAQEVNVSVKVSPTSNKLDDNIVWNSLNAMANVHPSKNHQDPIMLDSVGKQNSANRLKKLTETISRFIPNRLTRGILPNRLASQARTKPYGSQLATSKISSPMARKDCLAYAGNAAPILAVTGLMIAAAFLMKDSMQNGNSSGCMDCLQSLNCFNFDHPYSYMAGSNAATGDYGSAFLFWTQSSHNSSAFWDGYLCGSISNAVQGLGEIVGSTANHISVPSGSNKRESLLGVSNKNRKDVEKFLEHGYFIKGMRAHDNDDFIKQLQENAKNIGFRASNKVANSSSGSALFATRYVLRSGNKDRKMGARLKLKEPDSQTQSSNRQLTELNHFFDGENSQGEPSPTGSNTIRP